MGVLKFSLKMLKTNITQTVLYLTSVVFSAAVLFNAYNIMNGKRYIFEGRNVGQSFDMLLLFVTALSMFLVFFSNSYFIRAKSKEFAIGSLSGLCSYRLAVVLCFQILTVGLIGSLLGILLGIAIMPAVTVGIYEILGAQGGVFSFSGETVVMTILVNVFIVCSYSFLGDFSYIFGKEIKDLINSQRQMYTPNVRREEMLEIVKEALMIFIPLKIKSRSNKPSKIFSLVLYFSPLALLFLDFKYFAPMLFIYTIISVIAIQRLLRYYFPQRIIELKDERYAEDKIKLVSLSNLHYSLGNIKFIVLTLAISTVLIVHIIGMSDLNEVKAAGMFMYVYALLCLGTSILYKFIIESAYRKHIFKQLRIMGYTMTQLKKIIREETIMLYGIVVIVPLIHVLALLIRFNSFGIVTLELVELLLGIFTGLFALMTLVSYQVYKRLVL